MMMKPHTNTPNEAQEGRKSRLRTEVFSTCQAVVQERLQRSQVIDLTLASQSKIPRFDRHEIVEGKVIGRGGFAVIREISSVRLENDLPRRPSAGSHRSERTDTTTTSKSSSSGPREDLAKDVHTKGKSKTSSTKYVLKELNWSNALTSKNQNAYMNGVVDMAMEAQYLANLSHPHILELRGISTSNQFGGDDGMFLVLEYLPETLSKRLNVWMHKNRSTQGVTGFVTMSRNKAKTLLLTRIRVARDIADAMSYLHSKNIIFRDLKPDNLGFNRDDEVKLFDFGLAKELQRSDRDANGLYRNMTGFTGAIRYMSPEVGQKLRYNLAADVYSWSMLLWYIMALEPPLGLYTPSMIIDRVHVKGHRPVVNEKWPEQIQNLLRSGWDQDIQARPSMEQIVQELNAVLEDGSSS